jgi:hypothetical protein
MFRNQRFFVFSSSSLDLREIRFFRAKMLGTGVLLSATLIGILFVVNLSRATFWGSVTELCRC